MNEEIDIIELLQRVKNGNAPKKIELKGSIYELKDEKCNINELYCNNLFTWFIKDISVDTKIKILDKPIIKELKEIQYSELKYTNKDKNYINSIIVSNRDKINEIIKYINEENKDE